MTEQELRDKVAGLAEYYAKKGDVYEWSPELERLIEVYNNHKPLTRGIAYKPELGGWCALFVSDLFIETDLSDLIVTEIGAYEMMANAKACGQWKARGTYIPKRGDIIVYAYQTTKDGKPYTQYHTGLVTNSSESVVYTTEGNVQDRVLMLAHAPSDKTILGYWAVDYASKATKEIPVKELPCPPSKTGTYTLKAVVSNNATTYKWVISG